MALRDLNNNEIENFPHLKFSIHNVVCSFGTSCYLNLRKIALNGLNVENKGDRLFMKLRKPTITATIFSSGKITCAGGKSDDEARIGARRVARQLQKLGFKVKFLDYQVVNVMSTSSVPFVINLSKLAKQYPGDCEFNPELSPFVFIKINSLNTSVNVYSTGKLTIMSSNIDSISKSLDYIYTFLYQSKS
ncbi:TATA box-binding 1 [Brachionus plicatilis]|uniref:TATA box-binding 1 n=1 Tax=Brachionus plicatilis TaxID=10195 RepID=A0A3M7RVZ6_BRAPC|nr:TATA box-binding 1 [Brachionus plicatilis]